MLGMPVVRIVQLRERARESLWLIPTVCVVSAIVLAIGLAEVDERLPQANGQWYVFSGGPDGARSVLSTIAASMITFTAVVFSVTMLLLQQASGQSSPRVLRTFLRDRNSQIALGLFAATFTYSLSVLPSIQSGNETLGTSAVAPTASVTAAIGLVLLSIGMFVHFINHTAQSIRVSNVIERVAAETRDSIDRLFPEDAAHEPDADAAALPETPPTMTMTAPSNGVIVAIDDGVLLDTATTTDSVVGLHHRVGDFVAEGVPLLSVWDSSGDEHSENGNNRLESLGRAIAIGPERTMQQDTAFGFRQLVDIAERALSPGTNDPTTAVQALDQIYSLLRRLGHRRFPSPRRVDVDGNLRLILPRPAWSEYVHLGLDEIQQYGAESIQVRQRLATIIDDLLDVLPDQRRYPLLEQKALLGAAASPHDAVMRQ